MDGRARDGKTPIPTTIPKISTKSSNPPKHHLNIPRLRLQKSIVSCKDNYTREKLVLPLGMRVRLQRLDLGLRESWRISWVWKVEGVECIRVKRERAIQRGSCVKNWQKFSSRKSSEAIRNIPKNRSQLVEDEVLSSKVQCAIEFPPSVTMRRRDRHGGVLLYRLLLVRSRY
jgi:hypothetical protein